MGEFGLAGKMLGRSICKKLVKICVRVSPAGITFMPLISR